MLGGKVLEMQNKKAKKWSAMYDRITGDFIKTALFGVHCRSCRPWSACRDSYGSAGERFDQHLYRSADAAYLHRFIEQSSRDM